MQNYILKTAIRNFMRNKSFAFINIIGLAVGIASCLLIYSIIKFELSFDTFHTNKDNIYRVISEFKSEEGSRFSSGVPFPVADALRIDYPQLIKVADIYRTPDVQISILDKKINETEKKFKETNGVFFTEPEFFEMFDIELLTGNYSSLGEPNNALLTQETAEKYFGNWEEALGKTIMYDNSKEFKVAGILKNIPSNSDFP
ncbi:MAG: ABC transporter permease, partial [Melioribacteraceae bacterium]